MHQSSTPVSEVLQRTVTRMAFLTSITIVQGSKNWIGWFNEPVSELLLAILASCVLLIFDRIAMSLELSTLHIQLVLYLEVG